MTDIPPWRFPARFFLVCLAVLCGLLPGANAGAVSTLAKVHQEGKLRCGIIGTPEDWNKIDLHGPLTAFDAEFCKAIVIAAGAPKAALDTKVFATELEAEEALSNGVVDVAVGVTPSSTSMWRWPIVFGAEIFYDAQGFLVRGDAAITNVAGLAGHNVCVVEGTENEKILLARTVARGVAINPMPFQEEGEMDDGLAVRHCDAVSAYLTRLAQLKMTYPKQLSRDKVLSDLLTLSPVAVAYRRDDAQWGMIVDWTIHVLTQAEASNVTKANIASLKTSDDPVVQRLLGIDWASSRSLGLTAKDWGAQVIAGVGNYGEIFDRTVGLRSGLQMSRGLNALWTNGGLMRPLPLQ